MIWFVYNNILFVGRKQKRSKMAFPYDEANNVHGLEERKSEKIETKRQIEFREKHNEYNEKSTMKCAKFLCFYTVIAVGFLFTSD